MKTIIQTTNFLRTAINEIPVIAKVIGIAILAFVLFCSFTYGIPTN